ncbi:putative glucose-6-phosphate 1-epimerase [Haloferula helveola]
MELHRMPDSIRTTEPVAGYPVYEIDHPTCTARVALHGAHVMEWQPKHVSDPVLYLSPEAVLREGKAIRGGIPVCWPWFNAHPTDPSLPSHGFARSTFWKTGEFSTDGDAVTLRFTFEKGAWHAELRLSLGEALEAELTTTNRGDQPVPVSGALHSYLRVGDISAIHIEGFDGCGYLDTVGAPAARRQDGPVRFDSEVDRIYDTHGSSRLVDPTLHRTITVEKSGSPSTVVWNPWIEKAAALGDLPDEGYKDFVCIEAAIANDLAVRLAPGESHKFSTRIRVEEERRL